MSVFIVRHVATPLNHPNESQSRIRAGGDAPVSAQGKEHIRRIAAFFKGKPIAGVHTSDTRRAGETGQAIAQATGAPLHQVPALRPWNLGSLQGQKVGDVEHIIAQLFANPHQPAPGGGESYAQFFNRFLPHVKGLLHAPGHHVIVTHGRNVKTLMSLLHGGGGFHPNLPPHDPRPTAPGDVYLAHPNGLQKMLAMPQTAPTTKAAS